MKKAEKGKLERTLTSYFKEIHKIYVAGNFREESFYPSLKELAKECSELFPLQGKAGVLISLEKPEAL